jgi:hypothetical protein
MVSRETFAANTSSQAEHVQSNSCSAAEKNASILAKEEL